MSEQIWISPVFRHAPERPTSVSSRTPSSGASRPAVARHFISPLRAKAIAAPVAPVSSQCLLHNLVQHKIQCKFISDFAAPNRSKRFCNPSQVHFDFWRPETFYRARRIFCQRKVSNGRNRAATRGLDSYLGYLRSLARFLGDVNRKQRWKNSKSLLEQVFVPTKQSDRLIPDLSVTDQLFPRAAEGWTILFCRIVAFPTASSDSAVENSPGSQGIFECASLS